MVQAYLLVLVLVLVLVPLFSDHTVPTESCIERWRNERNKWLPSR